MLHRTGMLRSFVAAPRNGIGFTVRAKISLPCMNDGLVCSSHRRHYSIASTDATIPTSSDQAVYPSYAQKYIDEASADLCARLVASGEVPEDAGLCWEAPCPLDPEEKDSLPFMRLLDGSFASKTEESIQRVMDATYRIPHIARAVGFKKLLYACESRYDVSDPRQAVQLETEYISYVATWLSQANYNSRKKCIDEIIDITSSHNSIFFPRFANDLFTMLYRNRLVQVDVRADPRLHQSFCGDSIVHSLRIILFDIRDISYSFQFLKRMIRRGALSVFNTSIEEYTAIVLQISSQRIGGCLLPVQVDDLLFALYSMVRGNRRLQNDYQNAIAQALESEKRHSELLYFVDALVLSADTMLSHTVLSRLVNSYIASGDVVRGYAALNCLRAGFLLDEGVVKYIEAVAEAKIPPLRANISAPELQESLGPRDDRSVEVLRKKIENEVPYARSGVYYHALKAFRGGPHGGDKALYREHIQNIMRRMWADNSKPDLRFLSKLLIENLHAEVSVEATLFCHSWLMEVLTQYAGRGYDLYFQQTFIEEIVAMLLRCFLKKAPQFKKESNELLEHIMNLNLKLSSESVWYLLRCLHRHRDHFPVISMYKDMTAKFEAQKQPQHAFVLVESLISLDELQKAEHVIQSLKSRGVQFPSYLLEKYPILILMRLRYDSDESATDVTRRSVAYAIRMISTVQSLAPATDRNLRVLKSEPSSWVWREMRQNIIDLLTKSNSTSPPGKFWMTELISASSSDVPPPPPKA